MNDIAAALGIFRHPDEKDQLANCAEKIREELDTLKWSIEDCVAHYPTDIFPEPDKEDFGWLHQRPGASERLHGSWARHLVKVIREKAELRRRAGGITSG